MGIGIGPGNDGFGVGAAALDERWRIAFRRIGQQPIDHAQQFRYAHAGARTDKADRHQMAFTQALLEGVVQRSEEHTSELQSLMRLSYAVFCLKKKKYKKTTN